MAQQTTMRDDVRRVINALRQYVVEQGWSSEDHRLLLDINVEWGKIHCMLIARSIPGSGDRFEWSKSVHEWLEAKLGDDRNLVESVGLVVRTFDQVNQGGLYRISPEYVDADELLGVLALISL